MPRVTITVPDKTAQPYRFPLDCERVTLGRGGDNDIVIDSGSVSVRHAEMLRVRGGYVLRDLGSTNGIKLDDTRSEEIALRSGIAVKLGDVPFDFLLADEELIALAREKAVVEEPVAHEHEIPPPKLPPLKISPQRPVPVPLRKIQSGRDYRTILLCILLASAAFFIGMMVRFHKETGGSLISAMVGSHPATMTAPAAPGTPNTNPAPETAPAAPGTPNTNPAPETAPAAPGTPNTNPAPGTPNTNPAPETAPAAPDVTDTTPVPVPSVPDP